MVPAVQYTAGLGIHVWAVQWIGVVVREVYECCIMQVRDSSSKMWGALQSTVRVRCIG